MKCYILTFSSGQQEVLPAQPAEEVLNYIIGEFQYIEEISEAQFIPLIKEPTESNVVPGSTEADETSNPNVVSIIQELDDHFSCRREK